MQGRRECTQLVRPRQGFSADRPTLLGIVARLCLAGGNLVCRKVSLALRTHLMQYEKTSALSCVATLSPITLAHSQHICRNTPAPPNGHKFVANPSFEHLSFKRALLLGSSSFWGKPAIRAESVF